jgi:hypothetical protein
MKRSVSYKLYATVIIFDFDNMSVKVGTREYKGLNEQKIDFLMALSDRYFTEIMVYGYLNPKSTKTKDLKDPDYVAKLTKQIKKIINI